jgi:septum formation protein
MPFSRKDHPRLYLASASPRRRDLLIQLGLEPLLLPQALDESMLPHELPSEYVSRLAVAKAQAALASPAYLLPLPVVAADTAVVCRGQVLGKPGNAAEAACMMRLLSGRTHQVLTALAVTDRSRSELVVVSTDVVFRELSDNEISAYWETGEPQDKAGGYAIQGLGGMFVQYISGSYSNVVGLPLFETAQLLAGFGMTSESILAGARA